MAMKVVTPSTVTFTAISQRAAVMRAAHALARKWVVQAHLIGDYADFLRLALRLAWDLARGVVDARVPTWARGLPVPAEAKALSEVGIATPRASFEVVKGENPFTAFMAAFGCAARWGWPLGGPNGHLIHLWAEQMATAQVVATCYHNGEDHIFWSW